MKKKAKKVKRIRQPVYMYFQGNKDKTLYKVLEFKNVRSAYRRMHNLQQSLKSNTISYSTFIKRLKDNNIYMIDDWIYSFKDFHKNKNVSLFKRIINKIF